MSRPKRRGTAPGGSPDASQKEPQQQRGELAPKGGSEVWNDIMADLKRIGESLEKKGAQEAREIQGILARVKHASRGTGSTTSVEARLGRIEALLTKEGAREPGATGAPASYAGALMSGLRLVGGPVQAPPRLTVRVQLRGAKDLPLEEVLREVKKTISSAAAIRVLRSGDVDVTVTSEDMRDRAQNLPLTEDLKIIRRDHFLEVPGVPLATPVVKGKQADNSALADRICEASKTLSPGLRITQI